MAIPHYVSQNSLDGLRISLFVVLCWCFTAVRSSRQIPIDNRAAIYIPFGHESTDGLIDRILLHSAALFIDKGYSVDILVSNTTNCRENCLRSVANTFHVPMKLFSKVSIVTSNPSHLPTNTYGIFLTATGHQSNAHLCVPEVMGIGKIYNFLLWSPASSSNGFLSHSPTSSALFSSHLSDDELKAVASYNQILVTSKLTHSRFIRSMTPAFSKLRENLILGPSLSIILPPIVTSITTHETLHKRRILLSSAPAPSDFNILPLDAPMSSISSSSSSPSTSPSPSSSSPFHILFVSRTLFSKRSASHQHHRNAHSHKRVFESFQWEMLKEIKKSLRYSSTSTMSSSTSPSYASNSSIASSFDSFMLFNSPSSSSHLLFPHKPIHITVAVYTHPLSPVHDQNASHASVIDDEKIKFREWQSAMEATNMSKINLLMNPSHEILASTTLKAHVLLHFGMGNHHFHHSHTASTHPEEIGLSDASYVTIIEAMSRGCVPLVVGKEGGKDVGDAPIHGHNSLFVSKPTDAVKAIKWILLNPDKLIHMSSKAVEGTQPYLLSSFQSSLYTLLFRGFTTAKQFRALADEGWRNYRKKKLAVVPQSPSLNTIADPAFIAAIVEPGISTYFELCVRSVMYHLNSKSAKWQLHVYHSKDNREHISSLLPDVPNVQYYALPYDIRGVGEYNSLMKDPKFWEPLQNAKSDSLMLRGGIEDFLKWDYVGAPWDLRDNDRVKTAISNKYISNGVGNGGFTLRSGWLMYQISKEKSSTSPPLEQEDLFYAHYTEVLGKMADRKSAFNFAWEVNCNDLRINDKTPIPLALHAAWYYMDLPLAVRSAIASPP